MPKPNKKELEFLRKTAEIESSGGKNLEHRELQSGMHAGSAAIGRFGLMPNTLDELRNRMLRSKIQLPGVDLKSATKEQLAEAISNNPELEDAFATQLLRTIKSKGVDDTTANYMWEHGHNKIPDPVKVKESPRTKKFTEIEDTVKAMLEKKQAVPPAAPETPFNALIKKKLP